MAALFLVLKDMKNVVHIGQGKAATTTLQKHVFPGYAKSKQIKYLSPEALATLMADPKGKAGLSQSFLASSEVLVGPPAQWDDYLDVNLDFFGPKTTILLVLRRPSGFLRSVYQQISHHSGVLIDPKTYFEGSDQCLSTLFAPELFDQERLVKIYAKAFDEVIVEKFETLTDLEFLRLAYDASEEEMDRARSMIPTRSSNRSFSQTAVTLSMKLKWMFGRPAVDVQQGTLKRTRRYKLWRSLMQGVFDRLYPYKSYRLDWSKVDNVDIVKMDAEYDKIPNLQRYLNGVRQPVGNVER